MAEAPYNGYRFSLARPDINAPGGQSAYDIPISELAQVAETFLGASQILKKIHPELETIGGPVDVAVISKGDGFVWIKRKHYFSEEFNPVFRLRYLQSGGRMSA